MKKQSNIIYWYRCGRAECDDKYIGESARTFEERFKEHLKAPSPIYEQDNTTGHKTTVENFKIIGREGHGISRTIKEAIYIRVNNPTLNRNVGKYNLPHIWDKVLFVTPELKNNIPLHLNICALEVKNSWPTTFRPKTNKYCTATSVHIQQANNGAITSMPFNG